MGRRVAPVSYTVGGAARGTSAQRKSRGRPNGRPHARTAKARWADLPAVLRRAARAAPPERRVTSLFGVLLITLAVVAHAHADPYALDFADAGALGSVVRQGSQSHQAEGGYMLLRGGSSVYAAQPTGPGVYHVRFRMIEAENFQYHVPLADFFKADPANPDSDGYSINWQPWGLITLTAMVGGERIYSREFIDPGPDNRNRYEPGAPVDLTLRVPPEGDCVEVYAFRTTPEGEPPCRFKLLDLPLQGHFGWRNTKAYSDAWVHVLSYRPE